MRSIRLSYIILALYIGVSVLHTAFINITPLFAQEISGDLIAKRRAELEAQLANLEKLLAQQQVLLENKRGERATLERDLAIIDAEVKKARIAIQAQTLVIADLENDIYIKEAQIRELSEKIDREKESLASLIRRTDELDQLSLVEIIFGEQSLSQVFEEYDDFQVVKTALNSSFSELEHLRSRNKTTQEQLKDRQASEEQLKRLHLLQQQKLKDQENEKARILKVTQGEETRYQDMISATQKSAAQIRSELFELRGSAAINLGDAIEFATFASNKTRVRPALILGVLKQETRLGEFLGNGSWSTDMHPTRDQPLFKIITATLGLDPDRMQVSAKPSYGWGGAMGPAQFIPSTWACFGGYINTRTGDCSNRSRSLDWDTFWAGPWTYKESSDRLRTLRGKQSPSNPWDNQDAFLATGLLMSENGASEGTLYAERLAALRYFAGWGNATNPAYAFYGDGVMQHAAYYQQQIDSLKSLER